MRRYSSMTSHLQGCGGLRKVRKPEPWSNDTRADMVTGWDTSKTATSVDLEALLVEIPGCSREQEPSAGPLELLQPGRRVFALMLPIRVHMTWNRAIVARDASTAGTQSEGELPRR